MISDNSGQVRRDRRQRGGRDGEVGVLVDRQPVMGVCSVVEDARELPVITPAAYLDG
jgi:hypothetical protein